MIRLAKPYIPDSALEKALLVLKSGNLVQGEQVEKFEKSLEAYLHTRHAVLVSSGTAALHLSLLVAGIEPDDEVIVPAFTFPATANAVALIGAKPVFVDIGLEDFCIDATGIEAKITSQTKAIIPVHEFGQAADIEKIAAIAARYDLKIIEDAACALGTEFNDQKIGTFGDVGCFSFHPRKAITTGEGGLVITDNPTMANRLKVLRNHGISIQGGIIDFVEAGFNYRMTDFQAVLGHAQLEHLDEMINHRREQSRIYDALLGRIAWIDVPQTYTNRKMVYQSYHVLYEHGLMRDRAIDLLKNNGVETTIGAYALNCLSYFKHKYHLKEDEFPNSISAYRRGMVLPIGSHLQADDIHFIAGIVKGLKNE